MAKVDVDRRFKASFFNSLALHPAIEEIENWGFEDGRFCVHLKDGIKYPHPYEDRYSMTFSSIREARSILSKIKGL